MKIEADKKKILHFVQSRFQVMQEAKQKINEIAYQSYKAYHMILDEKDKKAKEEWQATVLDPYVFIICESILPNIYDAFFQSEKFVDVSGRTPTAIEREAKIRALIDYYLEKSKIRMKAIDIIRSAIKYPASIVKIKYKYEIEQKIVLEEYTGKKKVVERVKYDGPDLELVPIWDFFIDPQATDIENARDIIHRSIQDYNTFLKNAKKTNEIFGEEIYDIQEIQELKNSNFNPVMEDNPIFDYGYMQINTNEQHYKNIELLEYWGKYDINGDGIDEDVIILIGNRERVLRVSENPYLTVKKPFVKFSVIRKENEFWGHSIPELLDNSWQELNFWRNFRIDMAKYDVLPPMLVPADIQYDYNDIKLEPAKIIWYKGDPNRIQFLNLPSARLAPQVEIQDLKQDMQQTAGPTDPIMGSNVGRGVNKTARGISIMASSSMARMNMMVQTLAESFKEVVRIYLELLRQYVEEDIKILNRNEENELAINISELTDDYEFSINFRDVKEVLEIEKQQIINLIAILGKIPGVNINVLIPILLEYFPRIKNKIDINTLLPQPPQMPNPTQSPESVIQGNPNIKNPIENISLQQLGGLK